jgi:LysM repeat protein
MRRSPARFLAPIALVAFAVALYSVVQDSREQAGDNTNTPAASPTASASGDKSTKKKSSSSKKKRKTYTVKNGDTPSGIAEKTGVSLETLLDLNPDLDPQTLSPGQKIRLAK